MNSGVLPSLAIYLRREVRLKGGHYEVWTTAEALKVE